MSKAEVLRRLDTARADLGHARSGWNAALTLLDESTGGYPSGKNVGAPSGVSDRTAALATVEPHKRDPAVDALARLDGHGRRLMTLLGMAPSPVDLRAASIMLDHQRAAIAISENAWIEHDRWSSAVMDTAQRLAGLITGWQPAERPDPKLMMCENCGTREKAENRRLCGWCHCTLRDTKYLPDRELIRLKDRRDRLTTADRDAFIARMKDAPPRQKRRKKVSA